MERSGQLPHKALSSLFSSGAASAGRYDGFLFPSRHPPHLHRPRGEDALPDARPPHRRPRPAPFARRAPAALLDAGWDQEPMDGGQAALDLLARPHEQVQPEHSRVSGRHLVTVVSTPPSDWLDVQTCCRG